MSRRVRSPSLLALSAAAAALPGYAPAVDSEGKEAGYRFTFYNEAELEAADAASGQASARYEIQTHQLHQQHQLNEDWSLSTDLMIETMSGASPWFVVPNANGDPVQVMSGATIQDSRYALYGQAWRDRRKGPRLGFAGGVSKEDDYLALSLGVEGQWDYDQKRSTLSLGLGYSDDELSPTDGGSERFPERVREADKNTVTAYAGLSRVLTSRTIAQLSLSLARDVGFLSDPYKLAFVAGQTQPDARPDERQQWAFGARLRHYLPRWSTTLRADWRHFEDDWDIVSDTVELGTLHRVGSQWRLGSTLRWYQQSRADFYSGYFATARSDGYHSSDYRLSPYGALSARFSVDYLGQGWALSAAAEAYDSDGAYAPREVSSPSPGLVDFVVYSLALSFGFDRATAVTGSPQPPDQDIKVVKPSS